MMKQVDQDRLLSMRRTMCASRYSWIPNNRQSRFRRTQRRSGCAARRDDRGYCRRLQKHTRGNRFQACLAESNLGDEDKIRIFLSAAREGIARGVRQTSQLLNFARQAEFKTCAADANLLLKNLELFLKYAAGPSVRIVLDCSPTIPSCLVDPSRFAAAILNLVVNARDAMPGEGGEGRIQMDAFKPCPQLDSASKAYTSMSECKTMVRECRITSLKECSSRSSPPKVKKGPAWEFHRYAPLCDR